VATVLILLAQFFTIFPSWAVDSPTITTQPASANPALNSRLTLTVQANVTDGGILSYQWRYRATTSDSASDLSDTTTASYRITGTNSASLVIDTVTAAVSGLYSVRVTNTLNGTTASTTSNEANIFVLLASEDFQGSSLTNPSDWVMTYRSQSASNHAYPLCLTAGSGSLTSANNTSTNQLTESSISGCTYAARSGGSGGELTASTDTNTVGQGALRLTPSVNNQASFVLYDQALSTNNGLDISFNAAMWGATVLSQETINGVTYKFAADGFTFFLKDGEDTNSEAGFAGGSLGYSTNQSTSGVSGALFGIGIDGYGNFPGVGFGGAICQSATATGTYQSTITRNGVTTTRQEPYEENWYNGAAGRNTGLHGQRYKDGTWNIGNHIVIRGPVGASRTNGYCPLSTNIPPKLTLSETSSATSVADGIWTTRNSNNTHLYRVLVDGSTIANPRVKLYVDGTLTLDIDAPLQFVDSNTFKFGFTGSTGGANQKIDVWSMRVSTYTGITTPDPPTNVTVSRTANTPGSFDISWSHNGLWGIGEAGSGTRQFVATVFNSTGATATNFSCTVSVTSGVPGTSCSIANIPAGTYTVRVVAINRSNLSSTNSTISSQITSNGDTTISSCTGAGAIVNGSFEQVSEVSYLAPDAPTGWRTTARATRTSSNGYTFSDPPPATAVKAVIELTNFGSGAAANVSVASGVTGTRLVEIAADGNGGSTQGIYQDVNTLVGSRVFWSYLHHRRVSGGATQEVSRFRAAPTPVETSTGNITVPAADVWTITEQASPFGASPSLLTDHYDTVTTSDGWKTPRGTFEPSTARTRFLFGNVGNAGSGNLIDDVRFTTYAACPITVRIVAGRASNFVIRNVEQDTSTTQVLGTTFRYFGPAGAEISALSGIPAGITASVSNTANTSSTFALSSAQVGTYTMNYRVRYVFPEDNQTYNTTSTLTVEVVPEVTARFPGVVPFDPTLVTKQLPGIRFATATNVYACFDQVNSAGSALATPTLTIGQGALVNNVAQVSTGPPLIDTGTVAGLTAQSTRIRITANSGVLGRGGSKYIRVRASSIDNTDGVAPSCANGISFVMEFRTIKLTQTRRYVVPLKNGRQSG
jgi:hypothetical protein